MFKSLKQWFTGLIADRKKLCLVIAMIVCLLTVIFVQPFSMQIVSDADTFQRKAKINGEDMTLMQSMRRLDTVESKIAEWNIKTSTSEYAELMEVASHSATRGNVSAFTTRLIVFSVAILGFIASVVLLKKTKLLLLTLGAVLMVFPFYWMIASSFKTASEMNLFPPSLAPASWSNVENYVTAWNTAPFGIYFFNSIVVCLLSVAIVMVTTILAAYAFSRLKFPGRDLIFTLMLSMMMVPFELLVITNYQTITRLGLRDTLTSLILPFTSSIFYTYILRNFFMSVPDSLYYSAQVDGSGNWQYLWKVMVPIAQPSLVTILLLNAMASWNSFMWPKLVISRDEVRTLPWALITFTTEVGIHYELIMAGATMVVTPMLILFLFARKQIVRGVARGGIKG